MIILVKGSEMALCHEVSPSSMAAKKQADIMKIPRPSASQQYNRQFILNPFRQLFVSSGKNILFMLQKKDLRQKQDVTQLTKTANGLLRLQL